MLKSFNIAELLRSRAILHALTFINNAIVVGVTSIGIGLFFFAITTDTFMS